jgi:large subunit ribosomal protein L21
MYAVVTSGGKQYRVEAGSELVVERLAAEAGSTITFDRVLLVGDGEAVTVGTPTVENATVSATVLGEVLGPKLIVFKFKQKATYRRKNGHRQHLTRVRIEEISTGARRQTAKPAKAEATPAEDATTGEGDASAQGKAKKPATRRRSAAASAAAEAETTKPATRARRTRAPKAEKPADTENAEE